MRPVPILCACAAILALVAPSLVAATDGVSGSDVYLLTVLAGVVVAVAAAIAWLDRHIDYRVDSKLAPLVSKVDALYNHFLKEKE